MNVCISNIKRLPLINAGLIRRFGRRGAHGRSPPAAAGGAGRIRRARVPPAGRCGPSRPRAGRKPSPAVAPQRRGCRGGCWAQARPLAGPALGCTAPLGVRAGGAGPQACGAVPVRNWGSVQFPRCPGTGLGQVWV